MGRTRTEATPGRTSKCNCGTGRFELVWLRAWIMMYGILMPAELPPIHSFASLVLNLQRLSSGGLPLSPVILKLSGCPNCYDANHAINCA
jgi:hypothetical protein